MNVLSPRPSDDVNLNLSFLLIRFNLFLPIISDRNKDNNIIEFQQRQKLN